MDRLPRASVFDGFPMLRRGALVSLAEPSPRGVAFSWCQPRRSFRFLSLDWLVRHRSRFRAGAQERESENYWIPGVGLMM